MIYAHGYPATVSMLIGVLKAREAEKRWRDYMAQMAYEAARGLWAVQTVGKAPFPYVSWLQMSQPHPITEDNRTGQQILDDLTADFRKRVYGDETI